MFGDRQAKPSLGDLFIATHALVTCRLDYCNTFYIRLPMKIVWKRQMIQNAAVRLPAGACYSRHNYTGCQLVTRLIPKCPLHPVWSRDIACQG